MTGIYFLLKNFNSKFYQQLQEKKKLLRNSRLLMNVGKVQRITIRSDLTVTTTSFIDAVYVTIKSYLSAFLHLITS